MNFPPSALRSAVPAPKATPPPESLTISPSAHQWRELVSVFSAQRDRRAIEARAAFGLPTDRPIIMTGHQCVFWHMGVLAKYLACDAARRALGGAPAWVAVDQDPEYADALRIPVLRHEGLLVSFDLRLFPANAEGRSLAQLPASQVPPPRLPSGMTWATADAERGASTIVAALNHHATAPTRAAQIALAQAEFLRDFLPPATTLFAARLGEHPLMAEIVQRMRTDPLACARTYNAAASAFPEAGVRRLDVASNRGPELPLWRISADGIGSPVFEADIAGKSMTGLAPKALLMTAFLRLFACDLFIHGTGGGAYDRVTDRWFNAWLPDARLAPTVVVTATRYLPLPPAPRPADSPSRLLADAAWRAHHALHDPATLNDTDAAERKARLVEQIRAARSAGGSAAAPFAALQQFLRNYRSARAEDLNKLATRQEDLRRLLTQPDPRTDRTWAVALFPPDSVNSLRAEIDQRFTT